MEWALTAAPPVSNISGLSLGYQYTRIVFFLAKIMGGPWHGLTLHSSASGGRPFEQPVHAAKDLAPHATVSHHHH
jgi:hypothetical protein